MNTAKLKTFAQDARRRLMEQVAARVEVALRMEGAAAAENAKAIEELKKALLQNSRESVIERAAYIWFNRFCALRFMDVNGYTLVRTVSPAEGATQPEILAEAKQGIIRDELNPFVDSKRVIDLLAGNLRSADAQGEAYQLLLVAVCNYYNRIMPYLFEKIDDYTELLMPVDLLSEDSVLSAARRTLDEENCQNVEVIGWLYQFYISEKKDQVFASKEKVSAENIPAATQLFTPHWIVRYLVENSLGRLWMLNHPDSRLVDRMEYYIKPEEQEEDFLKIQSPEELRICDPACGSGHMLTYAFDLLYAIYEEAGYTPTDIPSLILTHNLYGIEIDERAGTLAAFALTMKAREKYRRFFRDPIQPNICVMENLEFAEDELVQYTATVGRNLFTFNLETLLHQFKEAKHFGSLIRPTIANVNDLLAILREKNLGGQMFTYQTHLNVLKALEMTNYLSPKYHVVVANPPYMGSANMNSHIKTFLQDEYEDVKSDLFSAFIIRNIELALSGGQLGFMTPFVWMFIASYEKLREFLIENKAITSLIQLQYSGFDGATVPICTFTLENTHKPTFKGGYVRLSDFRGAENQAPKTLEAINNPNCGWFYRTATAEFNKIPASPIAYWASDRLRSVFERGTPFGEIAKPRAGLQTGDNNRFLRLWYEVSQSLVGFNTPDREAAKLSGNKWFPYNKGGQYRKWYGNNEYLVNWYDDGAEIKYLIEHHPTDPSTWSRNVRSVDYYFKHSITWSKVSSSYFGVRYSDTNAIFDVAGSSAFAEPEIMKYLTGFLCSKLSFQFMNVMNPTLNFQVGNVAALPILALETPDAVDEVVEALIDAHKQDWNNYETSWDFKSLPLLSLKQRIGILSDVYINLRRMWHETILDVQQLEEQNNRIFIEAYGLQDEFVADVSLEEITLNCNPHYRYGVNKNDEELEALLVADTMREFISYAVGCMFGRYALEKPGLILANQGETLEDYLRQVPNPTFPADKDNVIPILDGNWFNDDIVERFQRFLRLTFGGEHYDENLEFIEKAIETDIRSYFVREFYNDHVRRYKKRPIYWLFSSPKGSFNALIYMHRYRPDTVSVVLNDYLREYRNKLNARIGFLEVQSTSASSSKQDKTAALKELDKLRKIVRELDDYERDMLYPLATKQIKIDLDDGVRVNYKKFGTALKPIAGFDSDD